MEQEREEATKDLQSFKQKRLFNPKNVFPNHLFYDWLCVDLTSAFSTCSCQRVICKPFCNVKVKVFEVEFIVVCCNHI